MKSQIKKSLAKIGIRNKYDAQRHRSYLELKEKLKQTASLKEGSTVLIIFSKDRAMQLDALLRSYYFFVKNPIDVKVLFHASSKDFKASYDEVCGLYEDKGVEFMAEHTFKNDLIQLFDRLAYSKVLFMVDDLMFKESVDFKSFTSIDSKKYLATLRLGNHLSYAYTLGKHQKLPEFIRTEGNADLLSWSWEKAEGDWAYPLSVDGHLFDKEEIRVLVNELAYKAPNSFEEALQLMKPLYSKRMGVCYPSSIIVNNPCNKVQLENENTFGEISIEELNAKWKEGFRIDFEEHKGIKNKSAHQELSLSFVKR